MTFRSLIPVADGIFGAGVDMAKILIARVCCVFLMAVPCVSTARAADADPDKSAYTVLNPTPDSALRSLTTDRPTKSNSPITVDAGRFQIESDLANFTYDTFEGTKTRTIEALDPVLSSA